MSLDYSLEMTVDISLDDFAGFVRTFGGFIHDDDAMYAEISRGSGDVWLILYPQDNQEMADETTALTQAFMIEKLGSPPKCTIMIEAGHQPGSYDLLLDVAIALAQRWPSILLNGYDVALDLAGLQRARRESKLVYAAFKEWGSPIGAKLGQGASPLEPHQRRSL